MAKFTVGQQAIHNGRTVEIVEVVPHCSFISPAYQVRETNAILTVHESELSPVPMVPPKFKIGDRVFHYDGSAGTVEALCCERYIVAFDRVGYLAVDEQDLSDYPPKFAVGRKAYVLVSGNEPESTFWDAGEIISIYKGLTGALYSVRCHDAIRLVYENKLATCVPTYNCQCKFEVGDRVRVHPTDTLCTIRIKVHPSSSGTQEVLYGIVFDNGVCWDNLSADRLTKITACKCKTDYSFVYEDLKRRLERVEGILKHHQLS